MRRTLSLMNEIRCGKFDVGWGGVGVIGTDSRGKVTMWLTERSWFNLEWCGSISIYCG